MRIIPASIVALLLSALILPSLVSAYGSSPDLPLATGSRAPIGSFTVPASNVATSPAILDEHHVIYGLASPRLHPPTCVSCGQQPFTNFHVRMYVRDFEVRAGEIQIIPPRLLFTGPRGAQIPLYSLRRDWLIYSTVQVGDRWELIARNVRTGRQIPLDSPRREGTPSRFLQAAGDGRTVVWQSWTSIRGKVVSVIRSYSLLTGQRRLLVSGGTGQDYFYAFPRISGNRLVFAREFPDGTSQLFLTNLTTGQTRALTPSHQPNDQAVIAGNVVVWLHGRLTIGHRHGLVVANLTTGRRVALPRSSAQLPRIAGDRYVVFATDIGHGSIQVYDTVTGRRWVMPGTSPSYTVETGGRVALYYRANPCSSPTFLCRSHIVLTALP